jgi:ABC-type nitrate/sulfonate/bicarbonate transport system ATPase subunit
VYHSVPVDPLEGEFRPCGYNHAMPKSVESVREALIAAEGVHASFLVSGRPLPVLEDLSLRVCRGEWVTLVGPSGCGKTTLLRLLAGLLTPEEGRIQTSGPGDGRHRWVAYLPQHDTLLPWRTALENAVLASEIARHPRMPARDEARALFARFGLEGFERQYPAQLSGGMRQRLAIIRTFLAHRDVLLLDEPLGALDPLTRVDLQEWLLEVWHAFRKTVLLVTHDVEEAVYLSDRVHVLTPRPAHICHTVSVSMSRPRSRLGGTFLDARASLLEALSRKAAR